MATVWVVISIFLRLNLSAIKPPIRPNNKVGRRLANSTRPSIKLELLNLNTSQLNATFWIQVPISEINQPIKYILKLGYFKDLKVLVNVSDKTCKILYLTS